MRRDVESFRRYSGYKNCKAVPGPLCANVIILTRRSNNAEAARTLLRLYIRLACCNLQRQNPQ